MKQISKLALILALIGMSNASAYEMLDKECAKEADSFNIIQSCDEDSDDNCINYDECLENCEDDECEEQCGESREDIIKQIYKDCVDSKNSSNQGYYKGDDWEEDEEDLDNNY